ncbi:F0F1 ATP synthase subunit alpha [Candidatus Roizmanbacteria bacterium CG02_land_8_20_14_3_00_36_15]|uniref:ATP synthase subunit alpha n=1 Tax=Candidatus Roizmanbacteria bacterium CG_4_8_14_3_um_filter_36_10 TaxID=1974834 RepID=A0A2M8GNR0_9BACT|nr:MAG: F0F1 ATP synthase subunit alpha [Candidatus Roizmanbacteria bacterium CG03_land_8_20_14_0_80_36_21]PIV37653.1 MAG: F0F1 ATP synthase subunit alpha [Candidatus Roizmanbacteria bacterium CG02_land_8_20_14_3_00_36_15]PIY69934.1 MAG: F0F1 ATP synthase subunit alpha [Candidatus Roizmanbacteria bacterium CG_4_10_14_0_8_um_filter_36_36]PJA53483.1 MAG: F0F1 ATP synthase subunit alpha [Candidatus Roizmanbacteria bacterium CG_4_9_14_3_um_filter_36_11]PJC82182.1 MAG: F0F1 ATP synthase subunit alph
MKSIDDYLKKIKTGIVPDKFKFRITEVGSVVEIKDGVAILDGMDNVSFGELVEFENGIKGMVIDIGIDKVGIIILGDYLKLGSGDKAYLTGLQASIPVTDDLLGRVLDPIGQPLDGLNSPSERMRNPLEKIAPGVVYRQPVSVPLQTGIKAIDALIPIGRGQRELIIGDRGTGKTTIAVDSIINQKGQNVVCIYCAIGQKESKVAAVVDLLKRYSVLDYSVILSASAATPVSQQYLAPYSACAIGEYFMDKGKDVLIVYDDLTKHAWAYRQLSLVLRRPAGREAYPGDIFYLHSRLLERACCLSKKYGGGTMTALPIVETLEGDVSAYIPTNIISITDGQIFLETDLFNSGVRPAINIGISVSRVGGKAQVKAMKQVASKLKLDLAQYREMAAFSQFESDLDEETKKFLNRGSKITQILKQNKHQLLSLSKQVSIIWAGTKGYLDELPLDKVTQFEDRFMEVLSTKKNEHLKRIEEQKAINTSDEKDLLLVVKEILKEFINSDNNKK